MKRLVLAAGLALALAACNDPYSLSGKSLQPIPPKTLALMSEKGMTKGDPMLVRVYKKEAELEIWKKAQDGQYAKLKTFPICRWSGQLGPKRREGDRQTPEGFYSITPGQMNPNSAYYLSFDTGYPNAYDRAHNGTGSALMVHGTCSSRGCYAMTDEGIAEIYALARESFAGGQKSFQFQAYPFRMTAENLAKYRNDPNMPFWKNLKDGSDVFEITKREPKVGVCGSRYAFNTVGDECKPDPTLAPALAEKQETDRQAVAELIAKGTPSVRLVYADGGQHESFRNTALAALDSDSVQSIALLDARPHRNLGEVSRPDALAQGPSEVPVDEPAARSAPGRKTLMASAGRTGGVPVASSKRIVSGPVPADLASAAVSEQVTPAPVPPVHTASVYDRMIGSMFGSSAAAEEPSQTAGAAAVPSAATPAEHAPRKFTSAVKPAGSVPPSRPSAVPPAKPQASIEVPKRQVVAKAVIPGSQLFGPTTGRVSEPQ